MTNPNPIASWSWLRELADATSAEPWRWQLGDGTPFRDALIFSADGGTALALLPNRRGREQTDADACLIALAPALARGYAEAVDVLQADGHGQWKAMLCRLSGRKNEYCDGCQALAHAEELRGVVTA